MAAPAAIRQGNTHNHTTRAAIRNTNTRVRIPMPRLSPGLRLICKINLGTELACPQ